MKLIIFLAVATLANAANLDRNYLPPAHATTSGGSGNFLQVPVSGPKEQYKNGFRGSDRFNVHNSNDEYIQNSNNNGHYFKQDSNDFAQISNGLAQLGNDFDHHFENDVSALSGSNDINSPPERNAVILRQENKNYGDYYSHSYETENGIVAKESGVAINGVQAEGTYSYVGSDGQVYTVRYTADERGFQPHGNHLPTPPPIPGDILKALRQNAEDEANGIFDDGSYNPAKYESNYTGHNIGANPNKGGDYSNHEGGNGKGPINSDHYHGKNGFNHNSNADDTIVTNNALLRSNNGFSQNNFGQDVGNKYLPPNLQHTFKKLPSYDVIANVKNNANSFAPNTIENGYLPPRRNIDLGQRAQINQYRNNVIRLGDPKNTLLGSYQIQTGPSLGQIRDRFDFRANNAHSRGINRYKPQNGAYREYLPPADKD